MSIIRAIALGVLVSMTGLPARAAAPFSLHGEFIQGGLLAGRVFEPVRVFWHSRELEQTADGIFIIGLGRDAPAQLVLTAVYPDGHRERFRYRVARRHYRIQRVDGIAPAIMQPSKADLERSRREAQEVAAARAQGSDRTDFLGGFRWPVQGPITGVFGSQRVYNGVPSRPHYGVDIAVPTGTPVHAPAGGRVVLAAADMFYSGGTLIIDHGHGLTSTLLHLSRILVMVGDVVAKGEVVADSGATGRASGPHVDWRANWFDQRIDVKLLVAAMPGGGDGEQATGDGE